VSSGFDAMSDLGKPCSQCGAEFSCGEVSNPLLEKELCWCQSYPAVLPLTAEQNCRCPSCLQQWLAEGLPNYLQAITHEKALQLAGGYSNDSSLQEGIDFIIEDGNYVFSVWYHLKRGYCCGNGCRHCPYTKED